MSWLESRRSSFGLGGRFRLNASGKGAWFSGAYRMRSKGAFGWADLTSHHGAIDAQLQPRSNRSLFLHSPPLFGRSSLPVFPRATPSPYSSHTFVRLSELTSTAALMNR